MNENTMHQLNCRFDDDGEYHCDLSDGRSYVITRRNERGYHEALYSTGEMLRCLVENREPKLLEEECSK